MKSPRGNWRNKRTKWQAVQLPSVMMMVDRLIFFFLRLVKNSPGQPAANSVALFTTPPGSSGLSHYVGPRTPRGGRGDDRGNALMALPLCVLLYLHYGNVFISARRSVVGPRPSVSGMMAFLPKLWTLGTFTFVSWKSPFGTVIDVIVLIKLHCWLLNFVWQENYYFNFVINLFARVY